MRVDYEEIRFVVGFLEWNKKVEGELILRFVWLVDCRVLNSCDIHALWVELLEVYYYFLPLFT